MWVSRMVMIAALILSVACNQASDPENVGKPVAAGVIDYGNGVYYFPCTEAKFGNALSQFIKQHDELELVAMTGDGNGTHGTDTGYFAVFQTYRR